MPKFLPISGFKWIDPKEFDLNKYTSNSSKGCVLEVDPEYPKELRELHNDYTLAPDKITTKREMLSDYQLKFADLYNASIGKVKQIICDIINFISSFWEPFQLSRITPYKIMFSFLIKLSIR